MAAVPLALILIATLAVLVAVTPGAFGFDRWPDAPEAALSEREVVVDVPVRIDERADVHRHRATERDGATVVVRAARREPLRRPEAPPAAPSAPQAVADGRREPHAETDTGTTLPVSQEPEPQEPTPATIPLPELAAIPELPAKATPEDDPHEPDESLLEWDDEVAVRPRRLDDDQE